MKEAISMEKLIYPAIFHKEEVGGYSVTFPDLPGCNTEGNDLAEALYMAQDALGLYLYSLKQDKIPLPQSMRPEALILDKNSFVTLVEWDEEAYLRRTSNKAIKKTLTIPEWMNTLAEKRNINFSKTLQEALLEKLEA